MAFGWLTGAAEMSLPSGLVLRGRPCPVSIFPRGQPHLPHLGPLARPAYAVGFGLWGQADQELDPTSTSEKLWDPLGRSFFYEFL